MHKTQFGLLLALPLAGLLSACASTPANTPNDALVKAQYAIANAQQHDADQYAAKTLYNANQKLAAAKQMAAQKHPSEKTYNRARWLAQEATVDAELAEAQTHAKKATALAEQAQKGNRVLQQTLNEQESTQ